MILDVGGHARMSAFPLALCVLFIAASILALPGCGTNSKVPEMETSCTSGEECDDENPCTENDKCDSDGECIGEPVSCDDQRDCTDDACDAAGKCVHDLKAGYCLINGSCYEDGQAKPDSPCMECTTAVSKSEWMNDDTNECGLEDKCNAGAHCLEGECVPGTELLNCNDDNECTDDSCDPETGCVFSNVAGSCDDADPCTKDDACTDGVCTGALLDCNDMNECTDDSCSPDKGCQNIPAIGPCNDGDGCTLDDQCMDGVCAGVSCEEFGLHCLEGECIESVCSALSLDGEDDYVEVPHAGNLSLTGEFSIEVWFRTEVTTSDRALLRKGAGVANYLIFLRSDMTIACGMYVSGADKKVYYAQGTLPVQAGVWHHLAMTFDGVHVREYLDGALHASKEVPGTVVTNTSPLTFGYGYPNIWPNAFTHGAIDEVRIWERALSIDEIQDKAFEILEPETEVGLVGWWDFNEDEGEVVHDNSGNGNHGTVFGAQWTDEASKPGCCIADCEGKECGGDGCGVSCGVCGEAEVCQFSKCKAVQLSAYALIPAGTFIMGSPDGNGNVPAEKCRSAQEVQHQVQLTHSFYVKTTEVMQAEWKAVMGVQNDPSKFQACGGTCAANGMTWYEAVAYCNQLSELEGLSPCYDINEDEVSWVNGYDCAGYRLPTEAEWEYAARADTTTAFYNGDISDCLCDFDATLDAIGWYCGNTPEVEYEGCVDASENTYPGPECTGPQPVGQKSPNAWGLYDVSGGVWEWCWDWLGPYSNDVTDPLGPPSGEKKLLRGGSWGDKAAHARSAGRLAYGASYFSYPMGFRPVRTACELQCDGMECGLGFCGASCGQCDEPAFCYQGACAEPVTTADSGQTSCYNATGEIDCPLPGGPFFGQDGNYQGPPFSFADNQDGTVTDLNTGLIWARCAGGQLPPDCSGDVLKVHWQQGADHCEQNNDQLPGSGWRMATRNELLSIMHVEEVGCLPQYFMGIPDVIWTGTDYPGDPQQAYAISFSTCSAGAGWGKTEELATFRCVRGDPLEFGKLLDNNDGTVSDLSTGLIWQQVDDGQGRTWEHALDYCEALELAGLEYWRLPNAREIMTLMDYTLPNASIYEGFFPGAGQEKFWTGTTLACTPDAAYAVNHVAAMGYSAQKKTMPMNVRCVR